MKDQFHQLGQTFVRQHLFSEEGLVKKLFGLRDKVQGGEVKGASLLGKISQRQQALKDAMGG